MPHFISLDLILQEVEYGVCWWCKAGLGLQDRVLLSSSSLVVSSLLLLLSVVPAPRGPAGSAHVSPFCGCGFVRGEAPL